LRWYGLALFLAVLVIIHLFKLTQRSTTPKVFRVRQTIWTSLAMIFLWFVAFIPALVFPQYQPISPTGDYAVETSTFTYTDDSRIESYAEDVENRQVTVKFWYPSDEEGRYPLVLFSHGSFGTITSNVSLFTELASHGYVVGSISHPYQSLYSTDVNGKTTWLDQGFMHEISIEDAKTDRQQSYAFYKKWMDIRMGDIDFVLNTIMNAVNNDTPGYVYTMIDPTKIGVMGHSLGGSAALGIGETRKDIGAVLALESPFMYDVIGVEHNEFVWNPNEYPVPVLNVYSDSSWSHLSEWPQYALNAELLVEKSPIVYNVHLEGAGHLSLTDLAITSPFLTQLLNGQAASIDKRFCLETINQLALGFFDQYLKGQGSFIPKESYSSVTVQ
ncbi:alpha/beta hydrolase, partial [bacterium]|nr:alpha/beta hydrolase [bacterium]